jgi:FAD/FMN-containing dehydrogenase
MTAVSDVATIEKLSPDLVGRVIAPADADYDKARTVFYGGIDRRPAVIVRPADASQVARIVSAARETGLALAVRSGGHSIAGHSVSEGGIVLDLADMRGLEINPEARTAWAQTGLTAGEYDGPEDKAGRKAWVLGTAARRSSPATTPPTCSG